MHTCSQGSCSLVGISIAYRSFIRDLQFALRVFLAFAPLLHLPGEGQESKLATLTDPSLIETTGVGEERGGMCGEIRVARWEKAAM